MKIIQISIYIAHFVDVKVILFVKILFINQIKLSLLLNLIDKLYKKDKNINVLMSNNKFWEIWKKCK